jgi:hypothetical protein
MYVFDFPTGTGRTLAAPVGGRYPVALPTPIYGGVRPAVLAQSSPPAYGGAKGLILALGALFAVAVFAALFSSSSKDAPSRPQSGIPPASSSTSAPSPPSDPRQIAKQQQPSTSTPPQPPAWSPPPTRQEPPARTAMPRCVPFNGRMICE